MLENRCRNITIKMMHMMMAPENTQLGTIRRSGRVNRPSEVEIVSISPIDLRYGSATT